MKRVLSFTFSLLKVYFVQTYYKIEISVPQGTVMLLFSAILNTPPY